MRFSLRFIAFFILSLFGFLLLNNKSLANTSLDLNTIDGDIAKFITEDQNNQFTIENEYDSIAVKSHKKSVVLFSYDEGKTWNRLSFNTDTKTDNGNYIYSDLFFLDEPSKKFQFKVKSLGLKHDKNDSVFFYFSKQDSKSKGIIYANNNLSLKEPYVRDEYFFDENEIIRRESWGAEEKYRYTWGNLFKASVDTVSRPLSNKQKECITNQNKYPEDFVKSKIVKSDNDGNFVWNYQYSPKIRKIIVHHTAVNNTKNKNKTSKSIMQDIYKYHANGKGWGDIGYNFIIDPEGNIFEGRAGGDYVIAGHTYCANTQTIGISLMGNFEEETLNYKQKESLKKLIYSLSDKYDLNPNDFSAFIGKNTNDLVGHKDYSSTACPGKNVYSVLPEIRKNYQSKKITGKIISNIKVEDLEKGKTKNYIIQIENTGLVTWEKDNFWLKANLIPKGLSIIPPQGENLYFAGRMKENFIHTGEIATFEITVSAEYTLGLQTLSLLPVVDNKDISNLEIILPVNVVSSVLNQNNLFEVNTLKRRNKPSALYLQNQNLYSETPNIKQTVAPKITPNIPKIQVPPSSSIDSSSTFNIEYPVIPTNIKLYNSDIKPPEKPIRIKLSYEGDFIQIKGEDLIIEINDSSTIRKKSRVVLTNVNGEFFFGNKSIKKLRVRNKNNDLPLKIVSWNRPLAWDLTKDDNEFLGTLEIINIDKNLTVINELPLETYLKGIAEVSKDAPKEKQKAIAVVARSYAQFYMSKENRKFQGMPYDGDDTPERFQRYRGFSYQKRSPSFVASVQSTMGEIVTFNDELIKTPFFSESDGKTKSALEVWGWENTPYLQSKNDIFCKDAKGEQKGHGVGLSGCGATKLAELGYSYRDIISYYYTGVKVSKSF